jgi:hypothetical protein
VVLINFSAQKHKPQKRSRKMMRRINHLFIPLSIGASVMIFSCGDYSDEETSATNQNLSTDEYTSDGGSCKQMTNEADSEDAKKCKKMGHGPKREKGKHKAPQACTQDTDCPPALSCAADGFCHPKSCTQDADCGAENFLCKENLCRPNHPPCGKNRLRIDS